MNTTTPRQFAAALAFAAGAALCSGDTAAKPITDTLPDDPSVTITFNRPIFTRDDGLWRDDVRLYGDVIRQGRGRNSLYVYAGRFTGRASDFNVPESIFVDGVDSVFMYCFELLQTISGGATVVYDITFSPQIARTLNFIGAVNQVLNSERDTLAAEVFDPFAWVRPSNRAQSVAVQLGLWESKYENPDSPLDLSSQEGRFRARGIHRGANRYLGDFFELANGWEAGDPILGDPAPVEAPLVMLFENDEYQDMITADPPPGDVPAPATLGLLGLGLGLLRRRLRRAPARD